MEEPASKARWHGPEVSRERNFQRARRAREYLSSHSEWIVGRSRAFMDHPGYPSRVRKYSVTAASLAGSIHQVSGNEWWR